VEKPSPLVSRSEIIFLVSFTFGIALLTSIPHIVASAGHFPGTSFTGYLSHSLDSNNYSAYINQASRGRWLFRNPMTPEPHRPVFFNLEWLAGGKLAAFFHLSLSGAVEAERILALFLMCFSLYWLAVGLFSTVLVRRLALVTFVTGGGFGWIAAVHVLHVPIDSSLFLDLSNGNLFPFYWALKLPHFLASESLLTLGLGAFIHAERIERAIYYFASGLSFAAAGACRPYDMLFVISAISLFIVTSIPSQTTRRLTLLRLAAACFCVPLLAYYAYLFKFHPVFRWWSSPGNPAPAPWMLAIAFGPAFIFFLCALPMIREQLQDPKCKFLLCCLCTAVFFSYAHRWLHFAFQFATNILLPMLLVSFFVLEPKILRWKKQFRSSKKAIAIVLFANGLTSLALAAQVTLLARTGDFRISTQLIDSFRWLDAHSAKDEVVLADFDTASLIPQYTQNIVFCGYINAVDFDKKYQDLNRFFRAGTQESFRLSLLQAFDVRYVLLTHEEERALPELIHDPQVRSVFRNDASTVLAIKFGSQLID
jgi:hypothetical protein